MAQSLLDSAIYGAQFGDAELSEIFSDSSDARRMVQFESSLAKVQGRLGVIPEDAALGIAQGLESFVPDLETLAQGVQSSGVPVPALVAQLRKSLPDAHGQWLHWGATSQDVLDTALILACADALALFESRLGAVIDMLAAKSKAYAELVMAARTRGQLATPITLGLRIAKWAQPLIDLEAALPELRATVLAVQFGGASGANTAIAPHGADIADGLALDLGLTSAPPWHVNRNRMLDMAHWLCKLAVALAKISGDLILQMRSEIHEVKAGQGGGSSTMPQKSNPVGPETIRVLATLVQAAHGGLLATADHAEERDGGRWPVEWATIPQMFIASGSALGHMHALAETLVANEARIAEIIDETPGLMAEQASFVLAAHMPRPKAQQLVKEAVKMGGPLGEALSKLSDAPIAWDDALDPASVVPSCRSLAAQIFAARLG